MPGESLENMVLGLCLELTQFQKDLRWPVLTWSLWLAGRLQVLRWNLLLLGPVLRNPWELRWSPGQVKFWQGDQGCLWVPPQGLLWYFLWFRGYQGNTVASLQHCAKHLNLVKPHGALKYCPTFIIYSNTMCSRNCSPFVFYHFGHI